MAEVVSTGVCFRSVATVLPFLAGDLVIPHDESFLAEVDSSMSHIARSYRTYFLNSSP